MKGIYFPGLVVFFVYLIFRIAPVHAQCCAGGSGSCIAGGVAEGVLQIHQMEFNTNFQFFSSDKFFRKDSPREAGTFDSFSSEYEYFRFAYGVSKNLTISVESGYFLGKKEVGLNKNPSTTYSSSGIGDLVIFPRYNIISRIQKKSSLDITVGLGYKIPIGSYNDSMGNVEPFSGQTYYSIKPQAVQLSSGAQDLIFFTFISQGYHRSKIKVYANAMYILKGYNPNGEKLGDYFSVGLFAGRPLYKQLGLTLQMRYEQVERMKINSSVLMFGKPSTYFPEATGYKKVFLSPQLSYSVGKFSFYASTDLPLYQYINSSDYYTQVGSKTTVTVGLSFRFLVKSIKNALKEAGTYYCPMDCEKGKTYKEPGQCPKCGMDLVIAK